MGTPIYDFVRRYAESDTTRLHMPGHKGNSFMGCESLDITEINGADVLYSADGIIAESENRASELFGSAHTFFSTEGSTLCIKAMLALAAAGTPSGQRPLVLAARNVHKAFVYAAALLDLDVSWLYPENGGHLCVCKISADDVRRALEALDVLPCAVYLTSPDYLGNIADIAGIAKVCDSFGVPLLVDNAHGAYLKFLDTSLHPLDLGASMCCDSAHKTLPVLTGGAYLHIAKKAERFVRGARSKLSLFASTSPSYLTLCSLDLCNEYLADGYEKKLAAISAELVGIKAKLVDMGFELCGDEPLKLTVSTRGAGFTGTQVAQRLREKNIECEFADGDFVVLMVSAENSVTELIRVAQAFGSLEKREALAPRSLSPFKGERAMTLREAVFSDSEAVSTSLAEGRICASPTVSCPPAVPIIVSGEVITADAVRLLEAYGATSVEVVK